MRGIEDGVRPLSSHYNVVSNCVIEHGIGRHDAKNICLIGRSGRDLPRGVYTRAECPVLTWWFIEWLLSPSLIEGTFTVDARICEREVENFVSLEREVDVHVNHFTRYSVISRER